MSGCLQEECPHWDGHGCPCSVLDTSPTREVQPMTTEHTLTKNCPCAILRDFAEHLKTWRPT